jgi:hypothetical protein
MRVVPGLKKTVIEWTGTQRLVCIELLIGFKEEHKFVLPEAMHTFHYQNLYGTKLATIFTPLKYTTVTYVAFTNSNDTYVVKKTGFTSLIRHLHRWRNNAILPIF